MHGQVVVVDGGWATGKTELCLDLMRAGLGDFLLGEPPNSLLLPVSERSLWYIKKHQARFRLARRQATLGRVVLMERGLISTAAYHADLRRYDWDTLLRADGYYLAKHIILLGSSARYAELSDSRFGEAAAMTNDTARRRYLALLRSMASKCLPHVLILDGIYDSKAHLDHICEFISSPD